MASGGKQQRINCGSALAHASAARAQPPARVGAYYFGGWAGPRDGFHFAGLRDGPFTGRMPLYGWSDRSEAAMREQLRWAAAYGISFFVFDWYYAARASSDPHLNEALRNYESLNDHAGVASALLYVNTRDRASGRDDFVIPRSRWKVTVTRWVTQHFVRSDYLRIDGMPALFVLDSFGLERQLGGTRGVDRAFALLREIARAHGLPGVFVVGGVYVDHGFDWGRLRGLLSRSRYDAVTQYAYPAAPPAHSGERSYRALIVSAETNWDRFAVTSVAPYIPDVMAGWDPRPWNEHVHGRLFWYRRTPALFEQFVRDALEWSAGTPRALHDEGRPLILIEAWNELGEGSYIVPTAGTCHSYGRALARALGR
jgi:Glycosyltransferase WbsX